MNKEHFLSEIRRLKKEWPASFSEERIKIIWDEGKEFFDYEFTNICNHMIKSRGPRQSPVPNDFVLEFSKLREKHRYIQKQKESREAYDFMCNPDVSDEDIKFRMSMVKLRLVGKVTDEDWEEFKRMMK